MSNQPSGMTNTNGVILTVGIVCNNDRSEIVLPVASPSATDRATNCQDAVDSFVNSPINALANCISSDAYIGFVQGEGMVDGNVPYREDYLPTDHPGTGGIAPAPSQVAALIVFYADPADLTVGARVRIGKSFIPGIAKGDIIGDKISGGVVTNLQSLGTTLQAGFVSTLNPSSNWFRICATPTPRTSGTPCKRTINFVVRDYIATQRRRLIPR